MLMPKSQVLTISSREHLREFPEDGKKKILKGYLHLCMRFPLCAAFLLTTTKVSSSRMQKSHLMLQLDFRMVFLNIFGMSMSHSVAFILILLLAAICFNQRGKIWSAVVCLRASLGVKLLLVAICNRLLKFGRDYKLGNSELFAFALEQV